MVAFSLVYIETNSPFVLARISFDHFVGEPEQTKSDVPSHSPFKVLLTYNTCKA